MNEWTSMMGSKWVGPAACSAISYYDDGLLVLREMTRTWDGK